MKYFRKVIRIRAEDTLMDHQRVLLQLLGGFYHAVEVGVGCGRTSEVLLQGCSLLRLTMVDWWSTVGQTKERAERILRGKQTAIDRTEFAASRRSVVHLPSLAASYRQYDGSVDLVFVDVNHRYPAVLADCVAWWRVVRQGGILCGHDYLSPRNKGGGWGVDRAVQDFSALIGVPFKLDKSVWIMRK